MGDAKKPTEVKDNRGRVWVFDSRMRTHKQANGIWIDFGGKWLCDGKEASSAPDQERARRENTLCGDPFIAGDCCNYPRGEIIDYFCLACGSSFAAHDEDSRCWRILKSEEELSIYDEARAVCDRIEHGS